MTTCHLPPGITRGELTVFYSKLAEISWNSHGLYWWAIGTIRCIKPNLFYMFYKQAKVHLDTWGQELRLPGTYTAIIDENQIVYDLRTQNLNFVTADPGSPGKIHELNFYWGTVYFSSICTW